MLKTLKWIYKLGVRNERHRIAAYLQTAQGNRLDRLNDSINYDAPITSKKDATARAKRKADLNRAVDQEVINIIEGLFRGEERYERGESIMYPEDERGK